MARHVRWPQLLSVRSAFAYLSRAYPAEPQPKRIDEAVGFLADAGFWFVWTGEGWGLECRVCGAVYIRSGHAANHNCSGRLGATSFERAKSGHEALEASELPDRVTWDLPDSEMGFEQVTQPTDPQGAFAPIHSSTGQPPAPGREPICVPLQLHRDRS
jgi:hypothetical protein